MRCAQLIQPGIIEVRSIEIPERSDNALIRMHTVGVCGTDSSIVAGKIPVDLPRILGHEGVGVIEEPGPLGVFGVGERVLIDPGISCELCDLCHRGYPNLCRNGGLLGRDLDGVFADYASVAERQLFSVPDQISRDEAGLLQVLGTCVHAVSTAKIIPGDTAVVLGLGVAGQLIVQLLAIQGVQVIGITRSQWKRELAERHGAKATVSPGEAAAFVAELTDGKGPELVIEAVGTEATFAQAIELAGMAATIVLYGTASGGGSGLPYYQLYLKELSVFNPRAATKSDYQRAIELVAGGLIKASPLVSRCYGLDEASEAFEAVGDSSTLKVLMEVS